MKTLAHICTFALGTAVGISSTIYVLGYAFSYRTHNHVDKDAVEYSDERITVTRIGKILNGVSVATILYNQPQ